MKHLTTFLTIFSLAAILASLLAIPLAQAAGSPAFNNLDADQEFLQGRNVTQNKSFTDPVAANAGEEVDIAVYYHNTVDGSTAANTRVKVELPTAEALSHVIKGTLSADEVTPVNGTIVNGQEVGRANLTINSAATSRVEFVPGSVRWYPDRMATNGTGASLPDAQNGDAIISNGINLKDIRGCFQYAGFVLFRVKLVGSTPPAGKAILEISKQVRKAGNEDPYLSKTIVNPGANVDYRITVRNLDGVTAAKDLKLQDILPASLTFTGPATLRLSNGTTTPISEDLVKAGVILLPELKANDSLQVMFKAVSDKNLKNDACLINKAIASSPTAKNNVEATAEVCFLVITTPKPTPSPLPTVAPAPNPDLPKTGPEVTLALSGGLVVVGGSVVRQFQLKRLQKELKKKMRSLDIL